MCSLNDYKYSDDDDETSHNTEYPGRCMCETYICRKCKYEDVDILLTGNSGYCRTCFLIVTNHKFRAALGKSKIIRHGDSILVDHTGELNSTILLHLIKAGMNESVHKKLIFKTVVLYIDNSAAMARTNEERNTLLCKIAKEIKDAGFDGYTVSLSQVLNEEAALDVKPIDEQETNDENDDQLRAMLTNLSDDTSRTDLLDQLRRKLLLSAARRLNCSKVFVPDSAMDIVSKCSAAICLGRGGELSELSSFCDDRHADIKILRPMRDFMEKELMYYSKCHEISVTLGESVATAPATSIQALARNFTAEMDSQFPGTVSTVYRTAEKVSARGSEQRDAEDNCVLCGERLDSTSPTQLSAIRALEVSRRMSRKRSGTSSNKQDGESHCAISQSDDKICCNDNAKCDCNTSKNGQITDADVWKSFCYGCGLIFRNSKILHTAPVLLQSRQDELLKS